MLYPKKGGRKTILKAELSRIFNWAIDKRLREAAYSNSNSSRPFAGKQLIVCGDFFQLPPIVTNTTERAYLESIGGIRAFEIDLWKKADLHPIMLKDVYRQGNDLLFLDILRNLRHGEPHLSNILIPGTNKPVDSVVALNKLCYQGAKRRNAANEIAICTTRREADSINSDYFSSLESDVEIFRAQISGKFPEKEQPTLVNLELQLGARVMTLANKRNADGSFEYVNGDLGYITGIFNDDDGTGKVMVKLDNGGESLIEPTKWSVYRYEQERDRNTGRTQIKQIECGSFTQIPLRLAWAITIHKSQGMGFDQAAICLGNGCFADGQLYTAISRCRSLNGLKLQRKIFAEDVFCSEAVVDFYKNLERENMI